MLLLLVLALVWSPAVLGQLGDELDLTDFDFGIVGRSFLRVYRGCFYFLVNILLFLMSWVFFFSPAGVTQSPASGENHPVPGKNHTHARFCAG